MTRLTPRFPILHLFLLLGILLCASADAVADSLSFSLGYYDILDDEESIDIRAEYRWSEPLLWRLKTFAGIDLTTDGAVLALGGLYDDIALSFLSPQLFLIPSIGVGWYHAGSSGKDLSHPIEFRSQLELAYELKSEDKISIGFSHISNCGLNDGNPGAETLFLSYHKPLARLRD